MEGWPWRGAACKRLGSQVFKGRASKPSEVSWLRNRKRGVATCAGLSARLLGESTEVQATSGSFVLFENGGGGEGGKERTSLSTGGGGFSKKMGRDSAVVRITGEGPISGKRKRKRGKLTILTEPLKVFT